MRGRDRGMTLRETDEVREMERRGLEGGLR